MDFTATTAPADLVTDLSLEVDTRYTLENTDPTVSLYLREQVAAPSTSDDGHRVRPGELRYLTVESALPIWVWSKLGDCSIVVTPSVVG